MKSPSVAVAPLKSSLAAVVLLAYSLANGSVDPTLSLTMTKSDQNIVLKWFGVNAVPYQLQSSSNLITWTNSGAVITGSNSFHFITNSLTGENQRFYRITRLFPAANRSAVFNPATGLLTIVGDDFDNTIVVGANGETITVNGGAIPITGGTATTLNTVLIQVLGRGGNDQLIVSGVLPWTQLFGDTGNDFLIGGTGPELLVGGPGNDFVDGHQGDDLVYLGEGDDTFQWDPGDANDIIEGQSGNDTLIFNRSNADENFSISTFGARQFLSRDIGGVVLDMDGIERIEHRALGGVDNIVVNNLAGTAVTQLNIDLASTFGGSSDAQADTVTVYGTAGPDNDQHRREWERNGCHRSRHLCAHLQRTGDQRYDHHQR